MSLIFIEVHGLIIAFRQRLSIEQIVFALKLGLGFALVVYLLALLGSMAKSSAPTIGTALGDAAKVDLAKMLEGPLALKENGRSALELGLEQKLVFLAQSVRPDRTGDERVFRIGCRGSGGERVVHEGEAISCHLVEHPSGGLESVSLGEGNVSLVPHVLDARSLLLRVEQATGKAMEVVLHAASPQVGGGDALTKGKWLGADLFFHEYGGSEYGLMGTKEQIEVDCNRYVLYVSEGDFLSLKKGRWRNVGRLEMADYNAPLAQVVSIGEEIEIEAWDEKGFPLFYTKLPRERIGNFQFQPDQIITGAKLRTASQVSCKIGKKRFTLQPGDWILRSKENVRKLRSSEEIDAFLDHQIRGELIVIDRIDSVGRVSGKVFDESRTQLRPFVLQTTTSKNKRRK